MADSESSSSSSYDEDPRLSAFLEAYPIPLDHSPDEVYDGLYVFLSKNEHSPSSDDPGLVPDIPDPSEIHPKLIKLYSEVGSNCVLIQFWSIVKTGSKCLLETYNQPFVLDINSRYQEYRLRSHEYRYNIDPNNLEVEDDPFIINGSPANVFRSHLAEVIVDLRFHQRNPLVDCALECGLMSCVLIPICDASDQSLCVGVLEWCFKEFDHLLDSTGDLLDCLQIAGLGTFKVQKDLLYKTIGGLKDESLNVRVAFGMACKSLQLNLAQVSIAYEEKKRLEALTVTVYTDIDEKATYDYCDYVDMLPVKIMEGLAEKTLANYEPQFCRNIYKTSNIVEPAFIKNLSYLVLCLKSIHTGDRVDYVFEFLWPHEKCHRTMIMGIIVILKLWLPNFKFACGSELGDEVRVIDVGNSNNSGIQNILEFFKGEKSSTIPEASEEGRKRERGKGMTEKIILTQQEIEQQYGLPQQKAADNIGVSLPTLKRNCKRLKLGSWQGEKWRKREVKDSCKDQSDMNAGDNRVTLAPLAVSVENVTIKAKYQNDWAKVLHLPPSLITVKAVEKGIEERFELNAGSFKIKYCDGDEDKDENWILLVSDQDMRDCIQSSTSVTCTTIKLYVQPK